ncbi:MAG: LLM class flavin-dependent oxidoreductase [Solirubrobacteraceae bacterium]|nr:MAG: N5,N10-methylene tetrahydromethanopterin reductase [Solirubrobacterales bacterium]
MDIGIGLPTTIQGTQGATIVAWAKRADARGFSTLGVIDRVVYDNYEPLAALAAAAAVTTRIRLTTSILLAPLRTNHELFAKQAASIDRLSDGRLVLGLAVGGREDDYSESGLDFHRRGAELDALLERAASLWREPTAAIGPKPARAGGPELVFGGSSPPAFRRVAQYGNGWIAGGGGVETFREGAALAQEAWSAAGREGSPRLLALSYFALGDGARAAADSALKHYYAFLGPYADQIAASASLSAREVADTVEGFAAAGCDELILFPCSADEAQIELAADAAAL